MAASVPRLLSSSRHFSVLPPNFIMSIITGRCCHITPRESGTLPSILFAANFTTAPYRPVTGVAGIRVSFIITAPLRGTALMPSTGDTARAQDVTGSLIADQQGQGEEQPRERGYFTTSRVPV